MSKILMLFGDWSMGGGQNMVYELSKEIDPDKFDVHILCFAGRNFSSLEQRAEKCLKINYLDIKGKIGIVSILKVFSAIKRINPDIIHAHLGGMVFAIPWALLHKNKGLVVTAHTKAEKAFNKKVEGMFKYLLKNRKTKTRVVATSEENYKELIPYLSVSENVCKYVNNGIDIKRFYLKPHDSFTLINVARHDENKNQAALIRCFARLHSKYKNTKLFLLGDGDTHEALVRQVNDAGLSESIIFTGNVANAEDYYAISDLYVQTSHREAMPLSVLEAMAAGLPIVSTNVGGLCDVVRNNGYLVDDYDEDALFDAIVRIYEQSSEQYKKMSDESRLIVRDYSSEKMARLYEEIYEELL